MLYKKWLWSPWRSVVILIFFLCIGSIIHLQAQYNPSQIIIGQDGIMRWDVDSTEVTGFGINYTVPFAHAYRMGKKMGIDLQRAIDQDVYQFARLGLDLYRVHVWDCEISDTLGNLLDNEHLQLFDYLLFRLKERNINAVITPIAYWGNGWPEPDEKTPGFSTKYGKDKCLVDPDAIKAQERYLSQFVSHINPYTGIAYKNDPSILAFEISNEPHHRGTPEEVTYFVMRMKEAIFSAGCPKPVFYNVSHSVHLADAYYDAGIDGGTFQWYPTGLGFQKELGGNMLPNVDRYVIPFESEMKDNWSARFVYEFDAADMASSYMYPAMARTFRTAGMQLATHFSYDPTYLSPFNTEYNTHYMNLIYAPRKALSLMISAEVFRSIPLYSDYGVYPGNASFGPFKVSYADDLAEMVTEQKFYYTNHTQTKPPTAEKLEHIAGWGNSPLVQYEGTGAYFLDKIGNGLWSLEVLPDAIQVDNLFGRNSPDKTLAVLNFNSWPMKIQIPDLHKGYVVINTETEAFIDTYQGEFKVSPGKYMVMSIDFSQLDFSIYDFPTNESLAEYASKYLHPTISEKYVLHKATEESSEGQPFTIRALIASPTIPDSVDVWIYKDWNPVSIRMKRMHGYQYEAIIPADWMQKGKLPYWVTTYFGQTPQTYPGGNVNKPGDWNFDQSVSYHTNVVSSKKPVELFDAHLHVNRLNRVWLPDSKLVTGEEKGKDYLYIKINTLARNDPENPQGPKIADYSIRHFFGDLVAGRSGDIVSKKKLVLDAHSATDIKCPVQLALVMKDGTAFGAVVKLKSKENTYSIPLKKLKRIFPALLPRPYPTFLPYYSKAGKAAVLDMNQVESFQISVGPGMTPTEISHSHEVMIGRVWLE